LRCGDDHRRDLRPRATAPRAAACLANHVHSFRCRDCTSKLLEVDPGCTLARLIRAPDSRSIDCGDAIGDRRCRLASSLTHCGRGYSTEIRIRGRGR
jgi:hypothetical protein